MVRVVPVCVLLLVVVLRLLHLYDVHLHVDIVVLNRLVVRARNTVPLVSVHFLGVHKNLLVLLLLLVTCVDVAVVIQRDLAFMR